MINSDTRVSEILARNVDAIDDVEVLEQMHHELNKITPKPSNSGNVPFQVSSLCAAIKQQKLRIKDRIEVLKASAKADGLLEEGPARADQIAAE